MGYSFQKNSFDRDDQKVNRQWSLNLSNDRVFRGFEGFPDFGFGPRAQRTADFLTMSQARAGIIGYYYIKLDAGERITGEGTIQLPRYLDDSELFDFSTYTASEVQEKQQEKYSILGDDAVVSGIDNDTVERTIRPAYSYAAPVKVAFIPDEGSKTQSHDAEPEGTLIRYEFNLFLPRLMCERLNIRPAVTDVVMLQPQKRFGGGQSGYYDVRAVNAEEGKMSNSGYFTAYRLELERRTSDAAEFRHLLTPDDLTEEQT